MKTEEQHYSLQDFKSIVESSQDVIICFDKNHRHTYVNKAIESQTGIPQREYIGKTPKELDFPDHLCSLWADAIDYVFKTKKSHKIEFILPNGYSIDWSLVPELDDNSHVIFVITTGRDVTQFKKSQNQLKANQRLLKDAFKLNNLVNWETDLINEQIILNESFCNSIGLKYEGEGHLLASSIYFKHWVLDEDKDRFKSFYARIIASKYEGRNNTIEYRIKKPNGEVLWLQATVILEVDDNDVVYKAYGTAQDISYSKRTEDELEAHRLHLEYLVEQRTLALKRSEDKLLDAIQLANLSTWDFNLETEELRVEGYLKKVLPARLFIKDNVIQFDSFVEVIDPRDFKIVYAAFEKANKTTSERYLDKLSYRMFDHNGDTFHLNLTIKVRLNDDSKVVGLYGTIQDISNIISSKTENERLTGIIEATSDIVGILDSNRKLIYLNKAGENFYNDSVLLMPVKQVEVIQNDICKKMSNEAFNKKGFWSGENFLKRKDGTLVPVSQIVMAHYLVNGDLDCYSTIIRDISELKQTEENLKYKNNELDTFVYRVSHDLRGPIASMLGLYNVVKYEVHDASSLAFFEMYNNQILRLNETIIALIDLTRIKETTAESHEIFFEEIVDGSISSFVHLPRFKTIRFEKTYKLHKPYYGDKALLTTIIQNLIENAIKYSRPEVATIVKINVETTDALNVLTINVTDNGRGIKKEIQENVFNMFFRGDDTKAIGSGLGLYILKNAVDKLEGVVSLESKINEGASFTITIPIQGLVDP